MSRFLWMAARLRRRNDEGQDLIEYALLTHSLRSWRLPASRQSAARYGQFLVGHRRRPRFRSMIPIVVLAAGVIASWIDLAIPARAESADDAAGLRGAAAGGRLAAPG